MSDFVAPHGLAELQARYGKLLLGPDPRGGMRIISPIGWEASSMTLLRGLPGLLERVLYVHRDLAGPLMRALAIAQTTCASYIVRTIGCWNPRYKRTRGGDISVHAWGLAVDINAATNPLADTLTTDMPDAFVQAFKGQGFTWGGEFSGKKDAMHFQLVSGY